MTRRNLLVLVLVAVALAAGVAIGVAVGGGDDDDSADGGASSTATSTTAEVVGPVGPSTTTPTAGDAVDTAGLDGAALELAEAINRARQLTYHATYEVAGAEPVVVDIWRRPPEARRDTVTGAAPSSLAISEYRTPAGEHIGCVLSPEEANQDLCVVAPPDGTDPADPIIGVIDPRTMSVTASDDEVGGSSVRCFRAPVEEGLTAEACFDADGIPVAIDGGDGRLVRVALERGVADEEFVLPAQPTSSG